MTALDWLALLGLAAVVVQVGAFLTSDHSTQRLVRDRARELEKRTMTVTSPTEMAAPHWDEFRKHTAECGTAYRGCAPNCVARALDAAWQQGYDEGRREAAEEAAEDGGALERIAGAPTRALDGPGRVK